MKYTVTQKELKKDQIIQKVYKTVDQQNHIRIKWDCLKVDEYNLIIVVRTLNTSFDLAAIERTADIPEGTDIFVYSRRETERHAETRQLDKNYTYYVYPGKLASEGEIEIYRQKDGNNVITEESRTTFTDRYIMPKGKLYYRLLFPIPFAGWNKRACLCMVGKSQYTDRDIIHYKVSGSTEEYSIRLTDTSDEIVIPLKYGQKVSFCDQEIDIEETDFKEWRSWKRIEHGKGV